MSILFARWQRFNFQGMTGSESSVVCIVRLPSASLQQPCYWLLLYFYFHDNGKSGSIFVIISLSLKSIIESCLITVKFRKNLQSAEEHLHSNLLSHYLAKCKRSTIWWLSFYDHEV